MNNHHYAFLYVLSPKDAPKPKIGDVPADAINLLVVSAPDQQTAKSRFHEHSAETIGDQIQKHGARLDVLKISIYRPTDLPSPLGGGNLKKITHGDFNRSYRAEFGVNVFLSAAGVGLFRLDGGLYIAASLNPGGNRNLIAASDDYTDVVLDALDYVARNSDFGAVSLVEKFYEHISEALQYARMDMNNNGNPDSVLRRVIGLDLSLDERHFAEWNIEIIVRWDQPGNPDSWLNKTVIHRTPAEVAIVHYLRSDWDDNAEVYETVVAVYTDPVIIEQLQTHALISNTAATLGTMESAADEALIQHMRRTLTTARENAAFLGETLSDRVSIVGDKGNEIVVITSAKGYKSRRRDVMLAHSEFRGTLAGVVSESYIDYYPLRGVFFAGCYTNAHQIYELAQQIIAGFTGVPQWERFRGTLTSVIDLLYSTYAEEQPELSGDEIAALIGSKIYAEGESVYLEYQDGKRLELQTNGKGLTSVRRNVEDAGVWTVPADMPGTEYYGVAWDEADIETYIRELVDVVSGWH